MKTLTRQFATETKVLDEAEGIVEYIASDESIDHDGEIVRASGWKFNFFKKNAPFVDSHNYSTIDKLLGKVIGYEVKNGKLIETVQWAKDASELAMRGWKLTAGGFLNAVSVGFRPVKFLSKHREEDAAAWKRQLRGLGIADDSKVWRIFLQQEQLELSSVVIPANPNAVMRTAKAYKAGCIDDADLEFFRKELDSNANRATKTAASGSAVEANLSQACKSFERNMETILAKL